MPEEKRESLFQKQKKVRPKLEDVVCEYLDADARENALDFAEWLRQNKLNSQWASANSWVFSFKGKRTGYIKLKDNSFCIMPYNDMGPWAQFSDAWQQFLRDEGLCEVVWDNVNHCRHCLPCAPGKDFVILGKEFRSVCNSMYAFWNPDARSMDCVKRMILFRKELISAGKV